MNLDKETYLILNERSRMLWAFHDLIFELIYKKSKLMKDRDFTEFIEGYREILLFGCMKKDE